MDDYTQALLYGAAGWGALFVAISFLVWLGVRREEPITPTRFAPDPAFDPALMEDDEVAELDAIFYAPSGRPGAW